MQKNDLHYLMRLFLIIGLPFLVSGILVARYFPPSIWAEAERIGELTRYDSAAVLRDNPIGEEVLIEGRIGRGNPTDVGNLVAYVVEAPDEDDEGNEIWEEVGHFKPWLEIELADGTAAIANETYRFSQTSTSVREGRLRYSGLQVGEPIVAVGKLVDSSNPPRIEAEFIGAGTQAEYVASTRWYASFWRNFGIGFALLGVLLLGAGGYFGWRLVQKDRI